MLKVSETHLLEKSASLFFFRRNPVSYVILTELKYELRAAHRDDLLVNARKVKDDTRTKPEISICYIYISTIKFIMNENI